MQNVHFTTRQIGQMLGVNESTIKRWIDRGMLKATKTPGGHRRIYQSDLTLFRQKYDTNRQYSYTLRNPRKFLPKKELWQEYYDLLLTNHAKQARAMLISAFMRNMKIIEIVKKIITPALWNIGTEWLEGKIQIHDEHRMSFHIREHLTALAQLIPEPKGSKTAVLACISGDWHEIPLQIASMLLKSHGWHAVNLGVNTPEKEIISASKLWRAQMIVVVKIYTKNKKNEFLEKLEDHAHKNNLVLVYGGNGWSKQWRHMLNAEKRKNIKHYGDFSLFDQELSKDIK